MDNSTTNHAASSVTVRVDLTSQDLRTGTVRLPRQLHDRFEAGPLTATYVEADSQLDLEFSPPGDLTGLQDFLQEHELKTNDALILHVDGNALRLEPFYRRPRAQPAEDEAPEANQGLFSEVQLPAAHEDAPLEEDTELVDILQLNPELQPGLFDDPTAAAGENIAGSAPDQPPEPEESGGRPEVQEESGGRPEVQQAAEAPAHAEPEVTAKSAAPAWSGVEATGSEFDAWADDDEDHLDELDAGLATFGAPQVNEPEQSADGDRTATARNEAADDLPPLPAWQAPVQQQHPERASEQDQPPEPQAPHEHSAFHVVQRRPFTPRGRSLPAVTRTSRTAGPTQPAPQRATQPQQAADASGAQSAGIDPAAAAGQASPGSEPPEAPLADYTPGLAAAATSPRQRIQTHLDSPHLPSILQAKQVAQELGMGEDEAADALLELSQLPDSRLSTVRPGFYLLKRDRKD